MSRVVKVNQGDYIVQTRQGGNMVLDTGSAGTVTVTGNLNVLGTQSSVNSTNTTIKDNIVTYNQGETGAGVSLGISGWEVDRGSLSQAQFLWNESVVHYDPVADANVAGTFTARIKNGNLSGVQVSTLVAGPSNLVFDLQNSNYVLRIANSTNYEQRVVNSNDIPNKKFVTDYVSATAGSANVNNIHSPLTGTVISRVSVSDTTVDTVINGELKTRVTSAGVAINSLLLSGDTITDTSVNNLKLTAYNNNVEVSAIMNLDNLESLSGSYNTTAVSGTTKLYTTAAEGPGRTGIHFVNNTAYGANSYNSDELVSKNRAVLLSILL